MTLLLPTPISSYVVFIGLAVLCVGVGDAFIAVAPPRSRCAQQTDHEMILFERRPRRRNSNNNNERESSKDIPQLPAFGGTSSGLTPSPPSSTESAVTARKFELQYTCNLCETRNSHKVSRLAYRQGVVIARCKGCDSQHLIADNLGWTDYKGGFEGEINDIEDFFNAKGSNNSHNTTVSRVGPDVFDLEKVLHRDTNSGSIVGEDGTLAME